MDLFDMADRIVVGLEGDHSNQAADPGGDTYWGVSRHFHPNETPWPPTWQQARDLRKNEYWLAHHCDQMPWLWALGAYDAEINQPGAGIRALQAELGLKPDGVIGTVSLAAIVRAGPEHFTRWMGRRIEAYSEQALWKQDALGWSVRALTIHHAALSPPPA